MPIQQFKASILVMDPNPVTLTALAATFDSQGYVVYCARSAQAVGKAIQQTPIDLIVWDVDQESNSVIDQIAQLRQQFTNQITDVPVFLIADSACAGLETRIDAIAPARCIFKPLDPNTLLDLAAQSLWVPHIVRGHHMVLSQSQAPATRDSVRL